MLKMLRIWHEDSDKVDTIIKLQEVNYLRNRIHTPGVGRKFFGEHKTDTKNGVVKYSTVPNGYDNINEVVLDFNRMIIFDLLTHQVNRHIGNFAFFKDKMYSLYDKEHPEFLD